MELARWFAERRAEHELRRLRRTAVADLHLPDGQKGVVTLLLRVDGALSQGRWSLAPC